MTNKVLSIITILLFSSCTVKNNTFNNSMELPEEINVPASKMNSLFLIIDEPVMSNSFTNGNPLFLSIENLTDEEIVISYTEGIYFYTDQNGDWTQIENIVIYPEAFFTLLPQNEDNSLQYIITAPYIYNLDEPITIYVFLVGTLPSDSNTKIGSYYKLIWKPEK